MSNWPTLGFRKWAVKATNMIWSAYSASNYSFPLKNMRVKSMLLLLTTACIMMINSTQAKLKLSCVEKVEKHLCQYWYAKSIFIENPVSFWQLCHQLTHQSPVESRKHPCTLSCTMFIQYTLYELTSLNWTVYGIEILLFDYIITSQIMENKNCLLTWSITKYYNSFWCYF